MTLTTRLCMKITSIIILLTIYSLYLEGVHVEEYAIGEEDSEGKRGKKE
jgi:hypothetical protein